VGYEGGDSEEEKRLEFCGFAGVCSVVSGINTRLKYVITWLLVSYVAICYINTTFFLFLIIYVHTERARERERERDT
jgi:hypothetical protein